MVMADSDYLSLCVCAFVIRGSSTLHSTTTAIADSNMQMYACDNVTHLTMRTLMHIEQRGSL